MGITTPESTLEVDGTFATTSYSGVPIALTGARTVYVFNALPVAPAVLVPIAFPVAGTCNNRRYVIVNRTGAARTTGTYINFNGNITNSIGNLKYIEIISDGNNWIQIAGN